MNTYFFIAMVFGLQVVYWLVGKRASRDLKTQDDYFLAGKTVRFFPLMMTFLATQVGGGMVLGSAEEAYQFGWPVLFYPLGMALGLMALGLGLGRRIAQFPVSTVAQILEVAYRSPLLKKMASVLSVVSLFMVLVAQIIASRKFLIAMGLESAPLFILFWATIIVYTVRGGLKAVIATDLSQAAFFSLVFFFCLGWVFIEGSYTTPLTAFADSTSKYAGWLLMPMAFMVIGQDMGQRCFAGDSPRTVSRAAFWAGVGLLAVCVVPIYFGILAKSQGLSIPPGASILMVAITQMTNPYVAALVGCAVLAAIISTATSLINAISSNLLSDFVKTESLPLMKTATALLSVGAIFFAFYFNGIVDIVIQSYELSCCLFVSIFMALFKREGNFLSALLSIVFGIGCFACGKIVSMPISSELICILASLLGFFIGEAIAWRRTAHLVR